MKNRVKYILQKLLGFKTYLNVFARYKIRTLRNDSKENDFFHFLSLLKDGEGEVIDVGANLGVMTVHLAQSLPKTTIHSIEPVPENFVVLEAIVEKYRLENVVTHEIALGDDTGTVPMIMPEDRGTRMQGLSHVKHNSITEWNEGPEFSVTMKTLDSLFAEKQVQAIKMDVENFEYFVLLGAADVLTSQHPMIYMELWENENRQKCLALLASYGYQAFVVIEDTLTPFDADKHQTQNFIFIVY